MPSRTGRVLIAGGGIGGLSAAIALALKRIASVLYERSDFAEQTGAGIQLGPNATRALRAVGALDKVEERAFRPDAIAIFDGLTGEQLTTVPLGREIERRYGAPYLTLHRADLHAALLSLAETQDAIALKPRCEISHVEQVADDVSVTDGENGQFSGTCLIAADGLWSRLRTLVAPRAHPRFSGATASRTLLTRADLPPPFRASIVGLWLGRRAHLVHYPVQGGEGLNVVAVTAGGSGREGWNSAIEADALQSAFADWAGAPRELLAYAGQWRSWSLYELPQLKRWHDGRVALLGDAAHPVLPYMAQGAGLAVEDAVTLASCLAASPSDPASAFQRYEHLRRRRARLMQVMSRRYGRLYHLGGALRHIRNVILKRRSATDALRRFDWLYANRPG